MKWNAFMILCTEIITLLTHLFIDCIVCHRKSGIRCRICRWWQHGVRGAVTTDYTLLPPCLQAGHECRNAKTAMKAALITSEMLRQRCCFRRAIRDRLEAALMNLAMLPHNVFQRRRSNHLGDLYLKLLRSDLGNCHWPNRWWRRTTSMFCANVLCEVLIRYWKDEAVAVFEGRHICCFAPKTEMSFLILYHRSCMSLIDILRWIQQSYM